MSLKYCFEQSYVKKTLDSCKKNDLAVIDTDGIDPNIIQNAAKRGVYIYGYLNAGALEKERSYYNDFKDLRLAKYTGWDGEYWVNITADKWKKHLITEAKKIKATGAIGLYFDNVDIYYMVKEGFKENKSTMINPAPSLSAVYKALVEVWETIALEVGLIVMPNGGDIFIRKMVASGLSYLIKTVNQESVLYSDNKAVSSADKKYFTSYLDWCKKQGFYIRGIEYCKKATHIAIAKAYYKLHGWQGLYISKHYELKGD